MTNPEYNPLVSDHKPSDGLRALLHPLALLTISDYITRHNLRQASGPIVGALLGRQHGRDISLENAFEIKLISSEEGHIMIHDAWFKDRLQQFKDVHKASPIDLVGWFTIAPSSGPQAEHVPLHLQILQNYNESAILLTFHPSLVARGVTAGGKLPLTIYESVGEAVTSNLVQAADDGVGHLEAERGAVDRTLRFREIPYTVETGEAEMICVDSIARGGGNATAVNTNQPVQSSSQSTVETVDHGKGKAVDREVQNGSTDPRDDDEQLSPENEEIIASLTARANAVKMLQSRIRLIKAYLESLPPSYLTAEGNDKDAMQNPGLVTDISSKGTNYPILRAVQAMINRVPTLEPADKETFEAEKLAEKNDVMLTALLGAIGNSVMNVREVGKKFAAANPQKQSRRFNSGLSEDRFGGLGGDGGGSSNILP